MSHSTSDRLDPLRAAIESGDKSRIADELHMLDKPSPGFASDDGSMRSHVLADHTDEHGETSYHQDQDQDQDQGTATSPPTCPLVLVVSQMRPLVVSRSRRFSTSRSTSTGAAISRR